jgi:hypothetical protein
MYYENEKEVGAGIREKIAEGVIKRGDVFVTSKVPPDVPPPLQFLGLNHNQFSSKYYCFLECDTVQSSIFYQLF